MARKGITGSGVFPSRNIFWFREESLADSDNLSDPGILTQEIVDDLDAALEQFREINIDPGGDEPIEKGGGTEGGQDPAPEEKAFPACEVAQLDDKHRQAEKKNLRAFVRPEKYDD